MPVVSPSRYTSTSSSLTGSYRSTLTSSSSFDKPYYRTSSGTYVTSTLRSTCGDRTTEYRSRYADVDGKRERKASLVEYSRSSRAPSVTDSDSGISTRYNRSERSKSRSRDISTTRSESSKTSSDPLPRNKRSVISTAALAMSTAELYNKYSPANYVPLTQRIKEQQQNQNSYGDIARSKSISNDIGRPPSDPAKSVRRARNSTASTIAERPEGRRSYKESSPSYSKRNSMTNGIKDNNGNEVPSVSEIRKRFDPKMTVTKLPANESYSPKSSVEQYLSKLKDCENGGPGYTKIPNYDKPVPVHLPCVEKNGVNHRWEVGSSSSRSNSNSDLSISKTISEPVSLAKPIVDKTNYMSTSLTTKLPSDRLASIKSQLDPNNPIGKILEKSTVIHVENGDVDYKSTRNSPEASTRKEILKNDIEKQVKMPKHTSNFASYIQISQPIASGAGQKPNQEDRNDVLPERRSKVNLKYIDCEQDDRLVLDNDIESPSGTGFENKTFEHENFLKKRIEKNGVDEKEPCQDGTKSMETSTESTFSEATEDSSPETSSRRRVLDAKDYDDIKSELTSGKSGSSTQRRSSERSDETSKQSQTSGLNGLRNIGNTCFMNSVLQCLSNTRPLLEYISEDKCEINTTLSTMKGALIKAHLMNSVLQCLSNTRPLLEYISEDKCEINTTVSTMKDALIKAFASVIKELWRSGEKDSVVNTTSLKSQIQKFAPRFMGYSQQDAQEFLRYLLEGLHEDVNRVTIKPKPILTEIDDNLSDSAKATEAWSRYLRAEDSRVMDIFVGQLKSTLRCTHCHHDSVTFDPFWDLSLRAEDSRVMDIFVGQLKSTLRCTHCHHNSVTFDPFWDLSLPIPSRTGSLKLQQCLQHFTKEEELDGDEKPTCSKCGVRRKCLKWFTVQKFPQVLVIHLKRFSPTERFRGKLNVLVEFPLTGLDMSPYAATRPPPPAPIYNLYAVSNHSGTTYSGHYTAYCKHPYTGDWHEYNDSRVSPINPRNVVSSEGYVLFYELARNSS